MIFRKFYGTFIMAIGCILLNFNSNAQEITDHLLYEHQQLFFNDLMVLGNHKVLSVNDRLHQSKRKMFLLDDANLVTDTMKTSAILDLVAISDSSFFVNDFNYSVVITIRNNHFVLSDIYCRLYDFASAFGNPAFISGSNFLFQKTDQEKMYNRYNAVGHDQRLYFAKRLPFLGEKPTYKIEKRDSIKVLSFSFPGPAYFPMRIKMKKVTMQNKDIKLNTILSPEDTGRKRTNVIYGDDNLEGNNDSLFIYEKNSCSLSVFCPQNQFKLISRVQFPVDDQRIEGWKYIFDVNTKMHYAVKRTLKSISENPDGKEKRTCNYFYQIYKIDLISKRLNEVCKTEIEPTCISEGLIYQLISNSQSTSSKIMVYPLDSTQKLQKRLSL